MKAQGADPLPPSSEDREKSFERGNYPPPPHWDRRAMFPNHIKLRTCSALAPMRTPLLNESAELTHYSEFVSRVKCSCTLIRNS
jgi:hypothetical protein